jgi:uncharacterized protein (DUF362 family)/Pyruvate/2-oxoacid:ferredoxin oxidoreductase delta subunit
MKAFLETRKNAILAIIPEMVYNIVTCEVEIMSTVIIKKCEKYDLELIKQKISETFMAMGGIEQLIPKDARVFVKLNCVGPFEPELAITTNPVFVQAVIQLIKTRTDRILIGDNPAVKNIFYTLRKCGIMDVIEKEKIAVFNPSKLKIIRNPQPKMFSTFEVSEDMADADVLINLPKLKTHTLTYMTAAQKNLFGFIFGLNKSGWHVRASNPLEFGEALNDLYGAILVHYQHKTMIHLCDGIVGLEGDGPSRGGSPITANIILASKDAVSLDRIACEIVHLSYDKLYVTKIAGERGYGVTNRKNIHVIGDALSECENIRFRAPKNQMGHWGLRLLKHKFIRNLILEHPSINQEACAKCGECTKICPAKTMKITSGQFPSLTRKNCIRCWCCAEVCPMNAIVKSKRPLIGRLLLKNRQ